MAALKGENNPVVEASPGGKPLGSTQRDLQQRIRQQEILAEIGVLALRGVAFDQLLATAAQLAAEGLQVDFCKILEYIPEKRCFLVRAGVGWKPGVVGHATVGSDLASPAGFALRTGQPVISNELDNEDRFRTPELLTEHGVRRAMNVILEGDRRPYGVLEVDSRMPNEFVEQDIAFLQGVANIVGMAIQRDRHERSLKAAIARQQLLLREMNHRVKNSLAIVTGMLRLQAAEGDDPELAQRLEEASARIAAIGRAHDRLFQSSDIQTMDIGVYVEQVCHDSDEIVSGCDVEIKVEQGIDMATDRAISVALIVVELITNAVRSAYQACPKGRIWVSVTRRGEHEVIVSVRDEGAALPEDFTLARPKGLGMRIVASFVKQLNATMQVIAQEKGTEFLMTIPLLEGEATGAR